MRREKHVAQKEICVVCIRSEKSGRDCLSGVLRYCGNKKDWNVRVFGTSMGETMGRLHDAVENGRCAGIIAGNSPLKAYLQNWRLPKGMPVVGIEYCEEDDGRATVGRVVLDSERIGRAAAELLIRRGYPNLGFVGISDGKPNSADFRHSLQRLAGMARRAKADGIVVQSCQIANEAYPQIDLGELSAWLKTLQLPCGVLAYNDEFARQVLDAARLAHLRVPEQLAILGVDNDVSICEVVRPTLSSVFPDFEKAGYEAAKMLDRMLTRRLKRPPSTVYGVREVVERDSTRDLRGNARLASQAAEWIRRNALTKLSFDDIAKKLRVTLRTLEKRYLETMGLTMREDVIRRRLSHAQTLLETTDLPLNEIARECGVERYDSFAALFKRRLGQSMGEYRGGGKRK